VAKTQDAEGLLRKAIAFHQAGNLPAALRQYEKLRAAAPRDAQVQMLRGVVLGQMGRFTDALSGLDRAVSFAPGLAMAHGYRADVLKELGRLPEAVASLDRLIALQPAMPEPYNERGTLLATMGDLEAACRSFERAISLKPGLHEAHYNLGMALQDLRRPDEALACFDRAIALASGFADAHASRGGALAEMGQSEEAMASYRRAIALSPGLIRAHYNLGNLLMSVGRLDEAMTCFDSALALGPRLADVQNNRGMALRKLGRLAEALESFDRAIALKPDLVGAHNNRASVLKDLGRLQEALESCDQALAVDLASPESHINRGTVLHELRALDVALEALDTALALRPHSAEAHTNRGNILQSMYRLNDALACYDRAIAIDPDLAIAHNNRAGVLFKLGRYREATECYNRVLSLDPKFRYAVGQRLHSAMHACDWQDVDAQLASIATAAEAGRLAALPGTLIAVVDDGPLQRRCAEVHIGDRYGVASPIHATVRKDPDQRIRIGYFSCDFRSHPLMHLMAEVLEVHDRERFEVYAFSYGPATGGAWRIRAEHAVDHFLDVSRLSNRAVAEQARALGIDVAVDLTGLCEGGRPGIMAERAAPVQASYLGYVGTTGAPFVDYLIADDYLAPPGNEAFYTEKLVYLPGCFQANCSTREVSSREMRRADHGLPEAGFVFCCFNSSRKFAPVLFDAWMAILDRVGGSVLWLWAEHETERENLRRRATERGIDLERLIFAEHVESEVHLKRVQLADLFLDTSPFNAGTTASDTLRMGVPLLTLTGRTFAARMSGSLLRALGLNELIAGDLDAYKQCAVDFARQPERLRLLRERLASGITRSAEKGARNLEAAYQAMHERHLEGLTPDHIRLR
jgi:protein O-GlcNAc transferase